jgi:hypothetical protein
MPTFTVRCRVDAYVDYRAEVEAETPHEAAELARERPEDYKWEEEGPVEFDARGYITLDKDGDEIDGTQVGYFG